MTQVNASASANTNSDNSANAAPAGAEAEKNIEAFYSPKEQKVPGPKVSLWIVKKTNPRSPDLDGTIGETRVAGYVQQGPKGKFINFHDSKAPKDAQGHYKHVGTGRVICGNAGIGNLVMSLVGVEGDQWANSSSKVPEDFMVHLGMDLADRDAKKAAYAASKATAAA